MLNKPTNVFPYNTFIDINDGLNLKFSLSNPINHLAIDIYDESNKLMRSDYHSAEYIQKDFEFDKSQTEGICNSGNYYWRTRYWRTPLEVNKKGNYRFNYIDSENGVVGVVPTLINDLGLGGLGSLPTPAEDGYYLMTFNTSSYDNLWGSINQDIQSGAKYYLYFKDTIPFYVKIIRTAGITDDTITLLCDIYSASMDYFNRCMNSPGRVYPEMHKIKLYDSDKDSGDGSSQKITDILEGDYLYLENNAYKIWSKNDTTDSKNPMISFSVGCGIPDIPEDTRITQEESGLIGCDYSYFCLDVYKEIEYNESPPYPFACRDKMDVALNVEHGGTPQINIQGTIHFESNYQQYLDIANYKYCAYMLIAGNKWDLVWESDKYNIIVNNEGNDYFTEPLCYKNALPNTTYKIKIVGQTQEGMEFEGETTITTEDFLQETQSLGNCVSFNETLGCVNVDLSQIKSSSRNNTLRVYRYNTALNELAFVAGSSFAIDCIDNGDGSLQKITDIYDFNVICNAEYVYYIFMVDDNETVISSFKSEAITPSWYGVYLTDIDLVDKWCYKPDRHSGWFLQFNYTPSDITRNYQVAHPIGMNQKYPKSVRGKSNFKTGSVSGLIGGLSSDDDYNETTFDVDKLDRFCSNGKLKLLRSSTRGESVIVDIDSLSTSVYGYDATVAKMDYTQIDDIDNKQINTEA